MLEAISGVPYRYGVTGTAAALRAARTTLLTPHRGTVKGRQDVVVHMARERRERDA